MNNQLGISMRMLISVSVVVVLYAATFLAIGISLVHLTQDAKQDDGQTLAYILLADEMSLHRLEVQQSLTAAAADHNRDRFKDAEMSAKRFQDAVEKYRQLARHDNGEQNLKLIETIASNFNHFYTSGKILVEARLNETAEAGTHAANGPGGSAEFEKYSAGIAQELSDFRELQIAKSHKTTASLVSNAQSTINMMVIGGLVASLSAALFAAWIARSVLGEMGGEPAYAADVVKQVADGNLTITVNVKPEDNNSMLFAVKDMIQKIADIVANIRNSTESITAASHEIASGNNDLSQRTVEQASSLEETSSSMEELLTNVRQNAESATHAYRLAQGSCDIAEQSGAAVERLVTTMTSINESSKKIEDIISVIDGIAFQTNILALNAAVEAARAGDQGRGFSVVAGEVRNLSQRSATAAKEIKQLIGQSVESIIAGTNQVKDAAETIGDVVTSVQLVASLMKDISTSTTEQSASIEQVNAAIAQMDEVTQQNAALAEETTATAESMENQAKALMHAVSIFKLDSTRILSGVTSPPAARPEALLRGQSHASRALSLANQRTSGAHHDKAGDWKEF